MKNFEGFGLSETLNKSLYKMDYKEPTPIQEQTIPLAMKGRDVLGSAQTGTGKTAAFSIPLVEKLLKNPYGTALVLTPTRELAKQVLEVIHQLLGYKSQINTAFIIGGEAYDKQMRQLRNNPRIIVGTPGRVNDHLDRGTLKLNDTEFLVLDETDRMLDMGFGIQLDAIVKHLPQSRQTLMFSATMPNGIVTLARKYLNDNAERISMGETNVLAKNIKTEVVEIAQDKKYDELKVQLLEREGSIIVFVKTKYNADRMAKNLRRDGYTSDALHGDLRQRKRDRVMENFRKQNFRILVATDIAARGLDVPHIEHVINYDLPQMAEDYIHRMGRTARAGAEGSALCFVSPQDGRKWHAIQCLLDPDMKPSRNYGPRKKTNSRNRHKGRRDDERGGFTKNRKDGGNNGAYGKKPFDQKRSPKKKMYADNDRGENEGERAAANPRFEKKPFDKKRAEESFKKPKSKSKKPFEKKPERSFEKKPFEKRDEKSFDKPKSKKPYNKSKRPGFDKAPQGDDTLKRPNGERPSFKSRKPRAEGEENYSHKPKGNAGSKKKFKGDNKNSGKPFNKDMAKKINKKRKGTRKEAA